MLFHKFVQSLSFPSFLVTLDFISLFFPLSYIPFPSRIAPSLFAVFQYDRSSFLKTCLFSLPMSTLFIILLLPSYSLFISIWFFPLFLFLFSHFHLLQAFYLTYLVFLYTHVPSSLSLSLSLFFSIHSSIYLIS